MNNRKLFTVLIVLIIVGLCVALYEPAPTVSPVPAVVSITPSGPATVTYPVKKKINLPPRCIFAEPGIGRDCRYHDGFVQAKVGKKGVKPYAGTEVLTGDVGY